MTQKPKNEASPLIKTPEFRLSYPHIFKPTSFEGQDPKYTVTMLFPKTTDISALKEAAQAAVIKSWPDEAKRPQNLRHPFRDGDAEKPGVEGYIGAIFVKASSSRRFPVFDRNNQPIQDESLIFAGCYCRAVLSVYTYNKMGNVGVGFGINGLQYVRTGDAFDGSPSEETVQSQFEDLGPEEAPQGEAGQDSPKPSGGTGSMFD